MAKVSNISFEGSKRYEVCVYPPAMFELTSSMRKADKPPLARGIADFVKSKSNAAIISKEKFVLDGGFLLHIIPWEKNTRYQNIALKYTKHVISNLECECECCFRWLPRDLHHKG